MQDLYPNPMDELDFDDDGDEELPGVPYYGYSFHSGVRRKR